MLFGWNQEYNLFFGWYEVIIWNGSKHMYVNIDCVKEGKITANHSHIQPVKPNKMNS